MEDMQMETALETMKPQIDDLQSWNDEKKKSFVKTFKERVAVSRWIVGRTACIIADKAESRRFISRKHTRQFNLDEGRYGLRWSDTDRDREECERIAQERANVIIQQLPPLKKAVSIIDKDTANMLTKKDNTQKKMQEISDELDEVCENVVMSELPNQNMTIAEFQKMMKAREKKRKKLLFELHELGKELDELERTVAKRLYAGLPGLSEAIVETIIEHIEQSKALGVMGRRIEEQVMFGDSQSAMEILSAFEKDEETLSKENSSRIRDAMTKLKASQKKGSPKKALGKGKRK
jgi:hypothetical protein